MRTRSVLVLALVVLLAAGAGGWWWSQRDEASRDRAAKAAVAAYATGWAQRDLGAVAFADPAATEDFDRTLAGMGDAPVAVRAGEVRRGGNTARSTLKVTWTLAGDTPWSYAVPVTVSDADDDGTWVVDAPAKGSYWNPDLAVGDTMTAERVEPRRGDLLDRDGKALMPLGAVYPVQLDPSRADPAAARGLEKVADEPAGSLVTKLAAAQKSGSKAPIPVVTYREADFDERRDALDALEGVIYPRTLQPLAATREFGQPLLGTVGPVTAEVVADSNGRYAAGERAGLSGLQGQYDTTLAGKPGVRVVAGVGSVLFEAAAEDGSDVATTLSPAVQKSAESALTGAGKVPAALVAVDVPSGEVLAAANSPATGFDRAITGRYAPGSAFKIATTYAYLTGGITSPSATVACPPRVVVDGKAFRNYEGESLGSVTFSEAFVQSCNTAFIGLSGELGDTDLADAAKALGVGAQWAKTLGVSGAFVGSVPVSTGATDEAAASIGQGRVEASAASLAAMTGSVARGSYLPPVLVRSENATSVQPRKLDVGAVAQLRTMMRKVVTDGTAPVLAGTPGGPVLGKTGTAEFGTKTPPQTRAWFVGYQGDTAFAILVEEGKSGGSVAAPIAKAFLTGLAR